MPEHEPALDSFSEQSPSTAAARSALRASPAQWISGARPRTLPLSIGSVALGTGAAIAGTGGGIAEWAAGGRNPGIAALCLAVALCLQIGVNFANDYSDGVRGTDRFRRGPARLTGAGTAAPAAVLGVALSFLALAAVSGTAVVLLTGLWWMLAVGAATIVAAWFYTGGARPYGYRALGEVSVFVFFGLVAVLGTEIVQLDRLTGPGWIAATAAGSFACGVLMVNNIRDAEADRLAGKRTLAVVVGERTARVLYAVLLLAPFALLAVLAPEHPLALVAASALAPAVPAVRIGSRPADAPRLIAALQLSSTASLVYALLLTGALALGAPS
ncbi:MULTISPECIES: 1,4-dihydroxy-2-naphthoate polyprenyltransferase [unclassified Rathayibacter]|uniref:1,4-dihydroxy-2-naphthoate polyprenyltransferase n=1 Tax=unclassified Rathayibacter TaxID=2609250 RepID=UPI000CE7569E|nr:MULTISPECIES: 1,4-dihydroxy-2-naphthoate polyprenyltransferase [unclassified Rathayibacter]PPI40962.1 1,4-dihydroxy-2-naphthoate polyprenyltransferase [Rathayibacter sp. RFBD1]PPI60850.1 1,4-dihydroxy-2-naphthoate polyprenyltransferase [Rathayibacter sp. TRS19]QHF21674.1 1,4-dihydroxy-2-naphthoate polyprenyltransferase [Rathayibacter sp. VKM Ac-2762]